jgi:hypothetical protein
MYNIFDALSDALRGRGNVYAQAQDSQWVRIYQARETERSGLFVRALGSGRWFQPQQWEVR